MKRWMLITVLGLCCAGGVSFAQQVGGAQGTQPSSASEQLDFSRQAVTEMREAVGQVNQYLQQAQQGGDEERIQCVRMKQASIKALSDVSERASNSMQKAMAGGTPDRAQHEFRKVAVALSKVRQFMAEAEACIGQGNVASGSTEVQVENNTQALTENDETQAQVQDTVIGVDPPNSSPFE